MAYREGLMISNNAEKILTIYSRVIIDTAGMSMISE